MSPKIEVYKTANGDLRLPQYTQRGWLGTRLPCECFTEVTVTAFKQRHAGRVEDASRSLVSGRYALIGPLSAPPDHTDLMVSPECLDEHIDAQLNDDCAARGALDESEGHNG